LLADTSIDYRLRVIFACRDLEILVYRQVDVATVEFVVKQFGLRGLHRRLEYVRRASLAAILGNGYAG
jgi:hypothetical protein